MIPLKQYLQSDNEIEDKYIITQPSMLRKIGVNDSSGRYLKIITDYANCITTKQLRCPNSGILEFKGGYRLLTELECWRLQGFTDEDYANALIANPTKSGCLNGTLYQQAGNSITVPVLESIFKGILEQYFTELDYAG